MTYSIIPQPIGCKLDCPYVTQILTPKNGLIKKSETQITAKKTFILKITSFQTKGHVSHQKKKKTKGHSVHIKTKGHCWIKFSVILSNDWLTT